MYRARVNVGMDTLAHCFQTMAIIELVHKLRQDKIYKQGAFYCMMSNILETYLYQRSIEESSWVL